MVINPPEQVPLLSIADAQDIANYVGLEGKDIDCESLAYDLTCAHQEYASLIWVRDVPTSIQEHAKYKAIADKSLSLLKELGIEPCEGFIGSITNSDFLDHSLSTTAYLQSDHDLEGIENPDKSSLVSAVKGIVLLNKISNINLKSLEKRTDKKDIRSSPREIFLGKLLPNIYSKHFRKFGISRGKKETPSGPAIRFIMKSTEKMQISITEEAAASGRKNYLRKLT